MSTWAELRQTQHVRIAASGGSCKVGGTTSDRAVSQWERHLHGGHKKEEHRQVFSQDARHLLWGYIPLLPVRQICTRREMLETRRNKRRAEQRSRQVELEAESAMYLDSIASWHTGRSAPFSRFTCVLRSITITSPPLIDELHVPYDV